MSKIETDPSWIAGRIRQFPIAGGMVYFEVSSDQRDLIANALTENERLRAWAEDEQRGRHKAEEDRMNARSEIDRMRSTVRSADRGCIQWIVVLVITIVPIYVWRDEIWNGLGHLLAWWGGS